LETAQLSTEAKHKIITNLKQGSITEKCALVGLARSTYYEHTKRIEARITRDEVIVSRLRTLAKAKQFKLGIRGLTMAYNRQYPELVVNHKRIARLKKQYDIPTNIRKKRYQNPQQPKSTDYMIIPDNVINRDFAIQTPFRVTGTDVTYLWIPKISRFMYLANVRDMATGEYLGWEISLYNDQDLADAAVLNMLQKHKDQLNCDTILHSDRGSTYTAPHFQTEILAGNNLIPSMSRKGNCIDNAPTESGHGHLKDWFDFSACTTLDEVKTEVNRVIHYFNEERPQWNRKKMTPIEYRNHLLTLN
jgi:transposase InsO family protein